MDTIMLIDKDCRARQKLERLLTESGYRVIQTSSYERLFEPADRIPCDLVIMEARLPGLDGLEALQRLRSTHPRQPVIILADAAETGDVIKASKLGAFDYVQKPFDEEEMLRLVRLGVETGHFVRSPVIFAGDTDDSGEDILVGRSQSMQDIYKAIGRVAPTDATVLIRGDSGTGKELVARAIYQHSKRLAGPFVIVNCVAIPENLLESELFGYEKGAFTGADRHRIGKIEIAHRGTVFLDEIGDIPLAIQAKLLRFLQERSIERIGGTQPIHADVRIIAATNADLEHKIKSGRFREDLYYRINVVTLHLPPLKSRPEDIPLLADYFMARFSKNLDVRNPGILPEAKEILQGYDWPGNVRELSNTIEKCLIFSKGRPVGGEEVAHLVSGGAPASLTSPDELDPLIRAWVRRSLKRGRSRLLSDLTDHLTKLILEETLLTFDGNRSLAAKELGISRPTLLYKLAKYGLDKPGQAPPDK